MMTRRQWTYVAVAALLLAAVAGVLAWHFTRAGDDASTPTPTPTPTAAAAASSETAAAPAFELRANCAPGEVVDYTHTHTIFADVGTGKYIEVNDSGNTACSWESSGGNMRITHRDAITGEWGAPKPVPAELGANVMSAEMSKSGLYMRTRSNDGNYHMLWTGKDGSDVRIVENQGTAVRYFFNDNDDLCESSVDAAIAVYRRSGEAWIAATGLTIDEVPPAACEPVSGDVLYSGFRRYEDPHDNTGVVVYRRPAGSDQFQRVAYFSGPNIASAMQTYPSITGNVCVLYNQSIGLAGVIYRTGESSFEVNMEANANVSHDGLFRTFNVVNDSMLVGLDHDSSEGNVYVWDINTEDGSLRNERRIQSVGVNFSLGVARKPDFDTMSILIGTGGDQIQDYRAKCSTTRVQVD